MIDPSTAISAYLGAARVRRHPFMILNVLKQVHDQVAAAVTRHYELADIPPFAIEVPPNRALGDLAVTVAFQLARTLRKAPRAIAQELVGVLGAVPGVAKVEAAPNGYLNLSLDRRAFLLARLGGTAAPIGALDSTRCRKDDRRAHGDQPEQGGAHRPSAKRRARRHAGARAHVQEHAGRSPELHRRPRRAGRRHHRRLPRDRGKEPQRDSADRRHHALRLLLLGSLFARHRVVRRPGRSGSPCGRRSCTISKPAGTTPLRSAPSSPIASSGRT